MQTVAQVLTPDFPRSWHEAVAIVQEAASQLQGGLSLPGPEDLEIGEDGTLTFGFGDESSEPPVIALAGLLSRLLEGVEAPAALCDLAAENAKSDPAHASVQSFSSALAFFERPNRVNDLRAVAGRLGVSRPSSAPSPEDEFQKLRAKVAQGGEPAEKPVAKKPESEKKKQEKKQEKKEDRKPRKWVLTPRQQALAGAAAGIIVFGTLALNSGTSTAVGSAVASAESGAQSVLGTALEFFGISKAASGEGSPVAADASQKATSGSAPVEIDRRRNSQDRAVRTAASSRPSTVGPSAGASTRSDSSTPRGPGTAVATQPAREAPAARSAGSPAGGGAPVAPVAPVSPLPAPDPAVAPFLRENGPAVSPAEMVYSEVHPEVRAPALLRPQLPREPAPGDDTGYFDMLVDEAGNVASVRLISPRRRYHDRMLVAAAKAWKFRPAVLDGQPVKYRILVPIILTGMP